jgi:hypothetical protein
MYRSKRHSFGITVASAMKYTRQQGIQQANPKGLLVSGIHQCLVRQQHQRVWWVISLSSAVHPVSTISKALVDAL